MGKRKWANVKMLEAEIMEMRKAGKSRQEIANNLGLSKVQIKNWVNRHNKKQAKIAAGIIPRPQGRPRKAAEPRDIVAEQAYEIRRLKMENELLRDFLRYTERE